MLPGGGRQWQLVKTGSSYGSQSELPLTFGLGEATQVATIRVQWPSGRVDMIGRLDGNRMITVQEGKGVIESRPIRRR